MTTQLLQFVGLPYGERDHRSLGLAEGDRVELHITRSDGDSRAVTLPPRAAALVGCLLDNLMRGARVAVLSEDQELTPNEAATILGMSRPLVVHRMEVGDLPFRYVGKHRRTRLKDVLDLKAKVDAQKAALDALADDTEALMSEHGI